jgi:hypothetical protein
VGAVIFAVVFFIDGGGVLHRIPHRLRHLHHRAIRRSGAQYWQEAEGSKSRAARCREEDAEKHAEAATRKAENCRLAEAEAAAHKASHVGAFAPKVTEADLTRRREEEHLRLEREAEAAKKRDARVAEE